MSGILSLMRNFLDDSRGMWLLSHAQVYTPIGLESSTSWPQYQLPEVCAPAQYFIDAGLGPALARRLSSTYMDSVDRYRKACQTHLNRVARGGHLTEYYCEVFAVLFKRTTQAWGSQIVSTVRVRLCQAVTPQAAIRLERVDIRVDDAAKAEITARLGLKATHLTFDRMVTSPSATVSSQLGVSQHTRASTDTADSHPTSSELSPISSTEAISTRLDPFCQPAPPTCFPAPYPPPPEHSSSYYSSHRALATSFLPPAPPRNMRPLTSYTPDVSSLTDRFGQMIVTAFKTNSTTPMHHKMFGISEVNKIASTPPPITANFPKELQLTSIDSIASPLKSTATIRRRRKIAALPIHRDRTSASASPPVFDSAGATPHFTPQVVEETPPDYILASPQKTRFVSTVPPPYTAEAPYFVTPKSSTPSQRKVHTLCKTLPRSQTIPQNQTLKRLATAGATFSYNVSRSPLVSDAASYFDSPPTSSDELDTPPSTPPSSHVLLASTSTESLTISSESDRIVSRKDPLSDANLPYYSRQRFKRLHERGLGRAEKPLTFTFSV